MNQKLEAESSKPKGRKSNISRAIKWGLKLAFTLALFLLIFRPDVFGIKKPIVDISFGEVISEIKQISLSSFLPWFLLATAVKMCGVLSSIIRWRLLLRGQGIQMNFWHLTGSFLVGRFIGLFLPGTLGLDGYRLYDVGRHTNKWIESTTVIAVEKLIGFIALTFLVFITLPFGLTFLPIKPAILGAILIFLGCFIAGSFACLLRPRILQVLISMLGFSQWPKLQSKLNRLAQAITAYSGQRRLLLWAVFFGVMVHLATVLMYFCTAMAIRTEGLKIIHILFASPLMIYGTVIGPSISGEGIRELIMVYLLGAQYGEAKTFLFSHLGLWAGESVSLVGGLILMIRSVDYRPRVDLSRLKSGELTELAGLSPEQIHTWRLGLIRIVVAALGGGLIGGALTGIFEGLYVVTTGQGLEEIWALPYAWFWHGMAGFGPAMGFAGLAVFFALWRDRIWEPRNVFAFSGGATFAAIALVFGRHRLIRDFLAEQQPTLSDNLHLLLIAALSFVFVSYGLKGLSRVRFFRALPQAMGALAFFIAALALLIGIGFANRQGEIGPPTPAPAPQEMKSRSSVLLICIDTLRADRLGCYGYEDVSTPAIDALAEDGIMFEQTIAQASWTRPSIGTILTGLYPSTHGAARKADDIALKVPPLAGLLSESGFFTGGLVNNYNIAPFHGFDRGFDHYIYLKPRRYFLASESASHLAIYEILRRVRQKALAKLGKNDIDVHDFYWPGEEVADLAAEWIERVAGNPFFYFVHFMDPHDPYMKHPFDGKGYARLAFASLPNEMRDELHETYVSEIEYVDKAVGRLVASLKESGLYDDLAIVLTADHGEEFLDHGGWWHGRTLYEEVIHVPLIVKLPGSNSAGAKIGWLTSLLDIAPTVCGIMGVDSPDYFQGDSLLSPEGRPVDPRTDFVFSEEDFEGNDLQAARGLDWKLLLANKENRRRLPPSRLFNLEKDPKEVFPAGPNEDMRRMKMRAWILKKQKEAKQAGEKYR